MSEDTPNTEHHDPAVPEAYAAFMRTGWDDRERDVTEHPVAEHAASRRARLAAEFPGERLVLPAGTFKVRANDTDYRFRPDTAHAYFSGNQTSDAVLVIEPDGEATLYARPRSGRDSDEFFRDRQYGALWAGRRPSLAELEAALGLRVRHVDELDGVLTVSAKTRVHRGVSSVVDALVAEDESRDTELARVVSELRLVKDEWELGELQAACDATTLGFEDAVADWDNVLAHGERWLEGTFFRRARTMGNDLGYDSIVAGGPHATTLHWIENSGPIVPGQLVLCDMGVEGHNLYTADVTRTMPISGRFTPLQRDLYTLVFEAQEAAMAVERYGVKYVCLKVGPAERLARDVRVLLDPQPVEGGRGYPFRMVALGHDGSRPHDLAQKERARRLDIHSASVIVRTRMSVLPSWVLKRIQKPFNKVRAQKPGHSNSAIWPTVAQYALGRPVNEPLVRWVCEFIAARKDCADFAIQGILRLLSESRKHTGYRRTDEDFLLSQVLFIHSKVREMLNRAEIRFQGRSGGRPFGGGPSGGGGPNAVPAAGALSRLQPDAAAPRPAGRDPRGVRAGGPGGASDRGKRSTLKTSGIVVVAGTL